MPLWIKYIYLIFSRINLRLNSWQYGKMSQFSGIFSQKFNIFHDFNRKYIREKMRDIDLIRSALNRSGSQLSIAGRIKFISRFLPRIFVKKLTRWIFWKKMMLKYQPRKKTTLRFSRALIFQNIKKFLGYGLDSKCVGKLFASAIWYLNV